MSNRGNLQCGAARVVTGTGAAQQVDALDGVLLGFIMATSGTIALNDANLTGTANSGISPQIPPVQPATGNLMLPSMSPAAATFVPMQAVYKNGLVATIAAGIAVTFVTA